MKNIIVFYGGKSVEHDISIITGLQAMENIDENRYNVYPIYVTRKGDFVIPKTTNQQDYIDNIKHYKKVEFCLGEPYIKVGKIFSKKIKIDCALCCMHGVNGEDGTISALCNLCNIPITCPNMLSSAICMDKIIMKDIFKANNLPCVDYVYFTRTEYENNEQSIVEMCEKLQYPLIVKPANLGSSIGIATAQNKQDLLEAIDVAVCYDTRIIVEKCLTNFREINCSAIGNFEECETSLLEEPKSWKQFLDFKEKYLNSKSADSQNRFDVRVDEQTQKQIYDLTKTAFKVFCCSGVIRIDYMYDQQSNKIYINELNTIPGSLAFYLWKHKYSYSMLIDKLIELAIKQHKHNNNSLYSYNSEVLSKNRQGIMHKYTK